MGQVRVPAPGTPFPAGNLSQGSDGGSDTAGAAEIVPRAMAASSWMTLVQVRPTGKAPGFRLEWVMRMGCWGRWK